MVDYSSVRLDCPSIALLFARLGYLLESVEERCLDWVSLRKGGLSIRARSFFIIPFSFPFC